MRKLMTCIFGAVLISMMVATPALAHHRPGHERPKPPVDSDADGISDESDNCVSTANPDQLDSDGDGVGDACDAPDPVSDGDHDGVPDEDDNCAGSPNPGQGDLDGDGQGDACDEADPQPLLTTVDVIVEDVDNYRLCVNYYDFYCYSPDDYIWVDI